MSGFFFKSGVLFADDVACAAIASEIPTPFYVYSAQKITDQYARLTESLKKNWRGPETPLVTFACKANSNIAVLRLLGSLGSGTDVVSLGEILRSIEAGIPPDKIVFSGVGKTSQELRQALELKIHQINVETVGELDLIIDLSRELNVKPSVAFRFTPNVEANTHAKISTGEEDHKFGLLEDEIIDLYARASQSGVILTKGISVHIGSQLFDINAFEQAFTKVAKLIEKLRAKGLNVSVADIGGGLGIPYDGSDVFNVDAYTKVINDIFEPLHVSVMLEPGRFLVAESGALVTQVTYIKERPERRFVIVDAGMNDLIRPTLYEAYHPIVPLAEKAGAIPSDIVGPVCETGDYFALERPFPPVVAGDLIAVLCSGAYGSVMSSQYNSRPLIAEIMVQGDKWDIVRKAQTIPDIWANEVIPGWLK